MHPAMTIRTRCCGLPRPWATAADTSWARLLPAMPAACASMCPSPTTTARFPARALGRVGTIEYHLGSHRYIDEAGLCHPAFHDELGKAEDAVGTAVAITAQSGPLGWIRLADQPRPEAAEVLTQLHDLGLRTIMLTGDNARTASAVASALGVGEQRAELLPADKVTAISDLSSRHGPTGMVGDGVNDAPALAAARVSIALGGISSGAASRPPTSSSWATTSAAFPG